jgi:leucyl-tRNA synthetase
MPQWAGSCWYYLRFIDPKNPKVFIDPAAEKAWMPVDLYIGGAEHAVLHLLYARFWHKVLYDLGHVSTKEPFKKMVHQGMILSYSYRDSKGVYRGYDELEIREAGLAFTKDGEEIKPVVEKMSKSKKRVINPDEIVKRYGADAFRMYEMFMGPLEDSKPWDMRGIEGIHRFLRRVWVWAAGPASGPEAAEDEELKLLRHQTIAKVTEDLENLKFNTAISALMIYLNKLNEKGARTRQDLEVFLTLLHPLAPHITDELWEMAGSGESLMARPWPEADQAILSSRRLEIPVQINGKVKTRIYAGEGADAKTLEKAALESAAAHLQGKTVVKVIVVPDRLVSIVAK